MKKLKFKSALYSELHKSHKNVALNLALLCKWLFIIHKYRGLTVIPFNKKRLSNQLGAEGIGSQVSIITIIVIIAAKYFWYF
jgi:hypothetical protein